MNLQSENKTRAGSFYEQLGFLKIRVTLFQIRSPGNHLKKSFLNLFPLNLKLTKKSKEFFFLGIKYKFVK
jgi:hypothetical protein